MFQLFLVNDYTMFVQNNMNTWHIWRLYNFVHALYQKDMTYFNVLNHEHVSKHTNQILALAIRPGTFSIQTEQLV